MDVWYIITTISIYANMSPKPVFQSDIISRLDMLESSNSKVLSLESCQYARLKTAVIPWDASPSILKSSVFLLVKKPDRGREVHAGTAAQLPLYSVFDQAVQTNFHQEQLSLLVPDPLPAALSLHLLPLACEW